METVVSLQEVVKAFGEHRAVDGLSLEVPPGDIFGLLGPNGAGKTTTIRIVMDIIRPDSGTVRVFGSLMNGAAKRRIGYLPEERGLYRKMQVLEMLEFQGSLKGASLRDARAEASGWLDRLGLADWKEKKVEELSKGMQQKVQFVATVTGRPELLILDEPFSGMDPVNQNLFKDVLLEIARSGSTIVFSTHQMDTAERLCRAIALIDRGRVVLHGPVASVKERFGANSVLMEYDGDGSFLRAIPGVERVDEYGRAVELRLEPGTDTAPILREAAGRLRIRRFEVVAPTLHNIFIEQVGRSADA